MAGLGNQQRESCDLGDGGRAEFGERVIGRRDDDELVAVDGNDGEASIRNWEGNDAEVDGVVDDGFQRLCVIRALDADGDIRVLALEVSEDFGKDVQAGAFIGADDDFTTGYTFGFGD